MISVIETDKTREARLRRMAQRQGYALVKSRRRDPRALGYGKFMIIEPNADTVVYGEVDSHRSLSLDEVENWLSTREMNPPLQYVRIGGNLRGNQKYKAHLAALIAALDGCPTFVVKGVTDTDEPNFVIVGTESQALRVTDGLLPIVAEMQDRCSKAITAHYPDKSQKNKHRFEYAWGYYFGFNQAVEQRLKPDMKPTATLTPPTGLALPVPEYDDAKFIEASISAGRRDGKKADLSGLDSLRG
jgi:hypothetical protein